MCRRSVSTSTAPCPRTRTLIGEGSHDRSREPTRPVRAARRTERKGPCRLAIDHVLPYSLWRSDDLWNLLPSDGRVNSAKSDRLSTRELLGARRDVIECHWTLSREALPHRFALEARVETGTDEPDLGRLFATPSSKPWSSRHCSGPVRGGSHDPHVTGSSPAAATGVAECRDPLRIEEPPGAGRS